MSLEVQNVEEAISLLKKAVKFSTIDGVKHLDFSLCVADERIFFQKALMLAQLEVENGTLTQEDLKKRLGLI
jgi:hypothetical protein